MSRPEHYGKWGQRGNLRIPEPAKGFCRYCADPIPPKSGRRAYCSLACRTATWLRISWPSMRFHIIERDKTCRLCDGSSYRIVGVRYTWESPSAKFTMLEIEWHVDHILPISEGGTDDPNNLRLLCGKCHKRITKEWHGERAAQRREVKPHTLSLSL